MPCKTFSFLVALNLIFGLLALSANAQDASRAVALINNVRIFDGRSPALSVPSNVLIRGNIIERISAEPIATDRSAGARIIDGGGRTLMPGLIDMPSHQVIDRRAGSTIGHNPHARAGLRLEENGREMRYVAPAARSQRCLVGVRFEP